MKIELFCVLLHLEPLYFFETVNLIYKKFTKCNVGYDHGFTWQSVSTNFISENPKQESWQQIQLCTDRQGHLNLWPPVFTLSPKPHCHNVITLKDDQPHYSWSVITTFAMVLGIPAVDVLRRGLSELTAMCEHMLATFEVRLSVR